MPPIIRSNRNRCSIPGILYNTNTMESFQALDKRGLLKAEAMKIWEDIHSAKAVDDCAVLSRVLLISFADLKKWNFHYWFAFPALALIPPATLVDLRPASHWFSLEEAESISAACNEWRNSSATASSLSAVANVPFFLVSIGSDSCAAARHLKDLEACQHDGQKVEWHNFGMERTVMCAQCCRMGTQQGEKSTEASHICCRLKLETNEMVTRMIMAWGVCKITLLDNAYNEYFQQWIFAEAEIANSNSGRNFELPLVAQHVAALAMEFILQAIYHPTYLEDLTGLTELMRSASAFQLDWDDEIDAVDDECVEL
ncbi:hypothetical protein V6N11_053558 [Hibiscus sabdariffa]|uniref:Ubiquitin-like modifier-activating enzyme Atg7 N-terminal domain-containing protein n=1 Tax=Hibiscus sabdariffa TaxID=183260 RepID=A0ABR2UE16_9ROSI